MTALVLLSGGLDSTVAAALRQADEGDLALGLWVDYGQRAAAPERKAARAVGAALGIEVLTTRVELLAAETRTALVARGQPLPAPDPAALDDPVAAAGTAAAVWVPNRNGVLVNLAAALAEARGHAVVIVGFNAEEGTTFPDNTPRFVAALNAALADSTAGRVRVECPTLSLTKAELVAAGRRVGAPIEASWSCYEAGPVPCGRCESCRRRERALGAAGGAAG